MVPHVEFAVHEGSQVGAARRHAAMLAQQLGFDEVAAGRLALVVTELGTNLVRHAREGRLLLGAARAAPVPGVEVVALDRGPGMADVERCLRDGFSTGGTAGRGLGAVRRLAQEFGVYSQTGTGTVIAARLAASAGAGTHAKPGRPLDLAGLCLAAPHESVSGDSWAAHVDGATACIAIADGLGHGPDAARAADAAIALFERRPAADPAELLDGAHSALHGTRGAALALARCDAQQGLVTFAGAGNIVGRLISGSEDRSLMTAHGTVGLQIRHAPPQQQAWGAHALVVLHSDGISTRWNLDDAPGLLRCPALVVAAWILHRHLRGRDDATVVVLKRQG